MKAKTVDYGLIKIITIICVKMFKNGEQKLVNFLGLLSKKGTLLVRRLLFWRKSFTMSLCI